MAFTLEDGTGKTNSNAYASVAEVDSYISDYARNDSTWASASTSNKERYIAEATQSIDLLWGNRFVGVKFDVDQALKWPRLGGFDREGYELSSSVIPVAIKRATAELAFKHANIGGVTTTTGDTTNIIPDKDGGGMISEETVKVGAVESTTKYEGGKRETKWYRKVEMILRPYLTPSGNINRA